MTDNDQKTLSLLGLALRANRLSPGEEPTVIACRSGKARLVLLSTDAAENARRKAETLTNGRSAQTVVLPYTRAELAASLGVSGCAAAAVTDLGFANALMKELAARDPEKYQSIAQETGRRCEKATRRKKETAARRASKRNEKRRTEA